MAPPNNTTKLSLLNDDPVLDAIAACVLVQREDGSLIGKLLEIDVADKSYKQFSMVRGVDNAEPTWVMGETITGKYHSVGITRETVPKGAREYLRETYPALAAGLSII